MTRNELAYLLASLLKMYLPLLLVLIFTDWLFSLFSSESKFILENAFVNNSEQAIFYSNILLFLALFRSGKSKPESLIADEEEQPIWLLMFYSMFYVLVCYLACIFVKAGSLYLVGVRNFGEDFLNSVNIHGLMIFIFAFVYYLKKLKSKK